MTHGMAACFTSLLFGKERQNITPGVTTTHTIQPVVINVEKKPGWNIIPLQEYLAKKDTKHRLPCGSGT